MCFWGPASASQLRAFLAAVSILLVVRPAEACTTFCLRDGAHVVFGRNYDYFTGVGRLTVNRRGFTKSAYQPDRAFSWMSRFGSVSFDQFGCEFPTGGMNEAGLVVELMMLEGTQYPFVSTPTLVDLQWIQYQLDTAGSVGDVLASDRDVSIRPGTSPLHFLVADRQGRCATVEFIGGRRVVRVDDSLPVAALTNHAYDDAWAYAGRTSPAAADTVSSLGRFVHAADAVRLFQETPAADPIAYAFATLEHVRQPGFTRWNVVYDLTNGIIRFRTDAAGEVKQVRLATLDFAADAPMRVADLNDTTASGEVLHWRLYSSADNQAVFTEACRAAGFAVSAAYVQERVAYAETPQPAPPLPLLEHPGSETGAVGTSLTLAVRVASAMQGVRYQWFRNGVLLPGATTATLTLPALADVDAARYRVAVVDRARFTLSRPADVLVAEPRPGRLVNMSVRGTAGIDGQPLIVGFVTAGGAKPMLVRAVGPTLVQFDVADRLPDPRMEVHRRDSGGDQIVALNDNWGDSASEAAEAASVCTLVGAAPFPTGSRDAMKLFAADGPRTIHVASASGPVTGVVLVEGFDAARDSAARLVNVSARNFVGTGTGVLIAGFVIDGNTPKRLLIRGLGPALAAAGVARPLANPRLELHRRRNGVDEIVATNDDWGAEAGADAAAGQAGAPPLPAGSLDAAIVFVAPAGIYTAVVAGVGDLTGEGLVEVFELP
jgi:choloylglycine hydrolase